MYMCVCVCDCVGLSVILCVCKMVSVCRGGGEAHGPLHPYPPQIAIMTSLHAARFYALLSVSAL
jgi:hypothetical protein